MQELINLAGMTRCIVLCLCLLNIAKPAWADNVTWPAATQPPLDTAIEAQIDELLARMTLPEKVGQMVQGEINHLNPATAAEYNLGSVLNGGGSWPQKQPLIGAQAWRELAQAFHDASMSQANGRTPIPILWGTDAVHGHNNLVGATLFPHNIGLGAANNPALMHAIGRITALETAATGIPWTFAPTLAVARDDRWGRTYESYAEDHQIVGRLGAALIDGLQGAGINQPQHIIATAKHFVADGGTTRGQDQGDTRISEATLKTRHASVYYQALAAGAQVVMASFSSWNGEKVHGSSYLLNDVLKQQMGFTGFVLGDWNGHQQVVGCNVTSCPAAINAGIDMMMVPHHWQEFISNTVNAVLAGKISRSRVDDAVRRILRVKLAAGLFDLDFSRLPATVLIGSPAHRAVAREAARQSLVLLKNDAGLLPLKKHQHFLVTGNGAADLSRQTGGWTVTWQGTENPPTHYAGATSIRQGIIDAVEHRGGVVHTNPKITAANRPDLAIVVFGEPPYTEGQGDVSHLHYHKHDPESLALLKQLKATGLPVVAVFLSGRPMVIDKELAIADAFIAAWLPGSEGGAIADALFADAGFNFSGQLAFSWPGTGNTGPVNLEDDVYAPLFPVGYGLRYPGGPSRSADNLKVNLAKLYKPSSACSAANC
ncbi:MAG: glycoside hydrolase family 3 N-terminal domain-containing protein [Pseudomonadota bacterium]